MGHHISLARIQHVYPVTQMKKDSLPNTRAGKKWSAHVPA